MDNIDSWIAQSFWGWGWYPQLIIMIAFGTSLLCFGHGHRSGNWAAWLLLLSYPVCLIYGVLAMTANQIIWRENHHMAIGLVIVTLALVHMAFARLYFAYGLIDSRLGTRVETFWDCLYFSLITWTTVGYGDIWPASGRSKALAAYQALTGYFALAALMAALSSAFSRG